MHSPQKIVMPSDKNKMMFFKHEDFQHPLPYIIYADFEAIVRPINTCQQQPDISHIEKISLHDACGYAYIIIDEKGNTLKPISVYRGPDAVDHFLKAILCEKDVLAEKLTKIVPIKMTKKQEEEFQQAKYCVICKRPLGSDRVRDHSHLTGHYRGAAHNLCNIRYKTPKKIPIIFHNLKRYDAHFIMQSAGKHQDHDINVIASNMENYITFSLTKKHNDIPVTLQFVDSFQFLPTSLQNLVENLNEDQFKILKQNIPNNYQLLLRKGIYPYEYVTCFEKFEDTQLPPIEDFYSKLTDENITQEEYAHAKNVWSSFHLKSLGEYHDLYVQSDVLQLADIYQNFRHLCMTHYNLDCAHFLTSPGLAWEACLKMSQQPLELITDINMHLFIENGIRGGISQISKRHSKANNKYLPDYKEDEESIYITYLDANNLYGWAMSQPLHYGEFKWMQVTDENIEYILSQPKDAEHGFILEVDLAYPIHLHNTHNDYPVAPEKIKIIEEQLSPYAKELLKGGKFHPTTKLITSLNDKYNYTIHYRNLQFYLSLGLQLKKVHKIVMFKQRAWLKEYVDFNTEQRKNSTSTFQKNFFKLMNNSVYGKTMENVRKHSDVQLVHSEKKAMKLVAANIFKSFKIFSEDLVGIQRVKKTVILNKPIYSGFCILELSKLHMYSFHYNEIKKMYGERATLLFTDTDSLTYEIKTHDVYEDMMQNLQLYDTSDYPPTHKCHSTKNKKVMGRFKDELNSHLGLEFIGLRSKMYSLLSTKEEKKTAKGVSRSVIKRKLKHQNYKDCLFNLTIQREKQMRINSIGHKIYTVCQNKISLSPFDDKRFILQDGVNSYAYGHYKTKNYEDE